MSNLPPHLTMITLGVENLGRSIAFYRALGWEERGSEYDTVRWFRTSGSWLGLFGHEDLADDVGISADNPPAFRGVTLAINVSSDEEVDAGLNAAVDAGATLVKRGTRAEWGGYTGYFADPDGHLWEVANAGFELVEGQIEIP
jgi:catechol 2,3-dioxygenase-like lactoylglutathione lyase family enzyme